MWKYEGNSCCTINQWSVQWVPFQILKDIIFPQLFWHLEILQPPSCFWINLVYIFFSKRSMPEQSRWYSVPPRWKFCSQIWPQKAFENLAVSLLSWAVRTGYLDRMSYLILGHVKRIQKQVHWSYINPTFADSLALQKINEMWPVLASFSYTIFRRCSSEIVEWVPISCSCRSTA